MSKTVVIIEDDADTLEVFKYIVESIGLTALVYHDQIELSELEKINPSLILLDHWLKSGYGGDYCRQVKDNPATSHIPVIIISFIATVKEVSEKAKADAYVNKPFDLDQLEVLIRNFTIGVANRSAC